MHKPRGLRSNEYDERVAALGERAVHTDLRLIDWTPFHSTTVHHRYPLSPFRSAATARLIPPHERTNIVDIIEQAAPQRRSRIFDATRRVTPDTRYTPIITRYTVKGSFFPAFCRANPGLGRLTFFDALHRLLLVGERCRSHDDYVLKGRLLQPKRAAFDQLEKTRRRGRKGEEAKRLEETRRDETRRAEPSRAEPRNISAALVIFIVSEDGLPRTVGL